MKKIMRNISKVFVQGFVAILPVVLTFYIIYWLAVSAESVIGEIIRFILPENYYIPGMGIVAGLLIILGVGILLRIWLFRKIFEWSEKGLEKLPFIKSLYGAIRDLMDLFNKSKKKDFQKVILISLGDNIRLMGLVTREDFSDIINSDEMNNTIAVYLPMSYQMGGFTVFVPKDSVEPVDMGIEEAMRFTLTAAVSAKSKKASKA
jgi:uncharacterized membrane protein